MTSYRKGVAVASVIGAMAAGGVFGATVLAPSISGAATTNSTGDAATSTAPSGSGYGAAPAVDPSHGGHTANGITETVLTGDAAAKAKAAALAAVPGGKIQRVETDADGAKYEAHMTKADGSVVTVKLDANFKVTSVESGMR